MLTSLQFGIKGLFEFTRSAFVRAEKLFDKDALNVDLSERVVIVTGSNSGLGFVTALKLASLKATVHMVCRNEQAGNIALEQIKKESLNPNVFLSICDLSSPKSIEIFTKSFKTSNSRLDVLVNNAGALLNEQSKTSDGIDSNFAANTLGTYFLTKVCN